MKKYSLLLAIMVVLSFTLTACGGNKNGNEGSSNKSEADTLTIGTEGTYPPFTFRDDSGKLTGFDVEIAQEVAKRMGKEAKFIETPWDGLIAGLDAKRYDIVVNQVGITDERKEKYDFSDPYTISRAVLIVKKDNNDVKAFEDLKGKKSAQSLTSNYKKTAESFGAEIVGVEGFNQAIDLILSNRADATINDRLSFLDLKTKKPDVDLKVVAEAEGAESGILIPKGKTDLVNGINKALKEMKDDGTFLKISQKWFGEDVSK